MLARDFSAAETDDGFEIYYPDEAEPFVVAKYGLPPEVLDQIRSRVVPADAPKHNAGAEVPAGQPIIGPDGEPFMPPESSSGDPDVDAALALRAQQQAMFPAPAEPTVEMPPDFGGPVVLQSGPSRSDSAIAPLASDVAWQESYDAMGDGTGDMTPSTRAGQIRVEAPAAPVTDTSLSPEEQAMAQRSLATKEKPGVWTPKEAPAAPAAATAGASQGGRQSASYGISQKTSTPGMGGGAPDIGRMPVDQEQVARDQRAADLALLMGDAKERALLEDAKAQEDALVARQQAAKTREEQLAVRQRTADQMRREIMEGKVDPTHLWSSMDGGRQALTMVGLVLGGLAGRSGPVDLFNNMIARDIDAQKDALNRKDSIFKDYLQEGRDAEQAYKLTMADMQDTLAAQLQLQASKLGSKTAMMSAEASSIALQSEAKRNREAAANAWQKAENERIQVIEQARKWRSDAQRAKEEIAIRGAVAASEIATNRAGVGSETPGKNPPMEIAPGVIVQPSDATSRQNLEKAVDAFNTMRNLIVEARAHRAENGAQFIPRTAAYVKANRLEKQLITALNNVENLGAFDKGTAELLGQIVPTIGGVYTPKVVDESLADLLDLATKKFKSKIMTNVVPGTGLVSFTGAQGDFKPVGKAD